VPERSSTKFVARLSSKRLGNCHAGVLRLSECVFYVSVGLDLCLLPRHGRFPALDSPAALATGLAFDALQIGRGDEEYI
jgi:hypothetical protein